VDLADHGERAVALTSIFHLGVVTALLYLTIIAFVVQGTAVEIAVTLMLLSRSSYAISTSCIRARLAGRHSGQVDQQSSGNDRRGRR